MHRQQERIPRSGGGKKLARLKRGEDCGVGRDMGRMQLYIGSPTKPEEKDDI